MHPVLSNLVDPFIQKLTNPPRPLFDDIRKWALCIPVVGHIYAIYGTDLTWSQHMNEGGDEAWFMRTMEVLDDLRTLGVIRNLLTASLAVVIGTVVLGVFHAISVFSTLMWLTLAGLSCLDIRATHHWMQSQREGTQYDGAAYGPLPLLD